MNIKHDLDPQLEQKLAILRQVPPRDPRQAERGLAAFLEEAKTCAQAVTSAPNRRHIGWMHALQHFFSAQKQEHSPMISSLVTFLLIATLVLGGGGTAVVAAQASQPGQPLYGVKLLSEDVRLGVSVGAQQDYLLALQFADRRTAEVAAAFQNGGSPDEALQLRYQNQLELAIQHALNLPDSQAAQALLQIHTRLQAQDGVLRQVRLKENAPGPATVMAQVRQMLQERLRWAEKGAADPNQLREQLRRQPGAPAPQRTGTPPSNGPKGPGGSAQTRTPASPPQSNPWTTGTPTPNSGYGPGPGPAQTRTPGNTPQVNPWTTGTPTPNSGYGPGPGPDLTRTPANTPQSNPWTTGTPTPNSGYGPGPGPAPTSTTSGNGPQPTQPQPNQPTQAGPQPTQPAPQPTQASPQPTQSAPQPTQAGPGPGGKH